MAAKPKIGDVAWTDPAVKSAPMVQDFRIAVRPVTTVETWPLRQSVLRPGRPLAAAQFPGDDVPTTKHFGAFQGDELVGIASLFLADMPEHPGVSALQLRGMATAPAVRGAGFGRALVTACVAFTSASGKQLIWCNARTPAAEFYRKLGWEILGAEFDVPDVGPHFHMWRRFAGDSDPEIERAFTPAPFAPADWKAARVRWSW